MAIKRFLPNTLMPKDWRKDIQRVPRMIEMDELREQRHRVLYDDQMYRLQEEALKLRLEKAYAQNPELVPDFFRRFRWPIAAKLKKLRAFLRTVKNDALRKALSDYVQHANRFRVIFVFRKKPPHFETVELLPGASTFHVKIVNGQLTPIRPADPDTPIDISFESAEVEVPGPLNEAIKHGQAKFIRIDDEEGSSCLSTLEDVTYSPEGVTFALHNAEQTYLMCLIGEKVSVKQLRGLGKTVTAILREKFGRGKAGRPVDLQKREQAKRLLKKPGPLKEKAFQLAGKAQNIKTQQAYFSRLLKEQKNK